MSSDRNAESHAGQHGDFIVFWREDGWYWLSRAGKYRGPFETSQAAFGDRKDEIDEEISVRFN